MEAKFEELIEGFVTGNIGISEDFLGVALMGALKKKLLQLDADSLMITAGIGNMALQEHNKNIRSDKTCWMDAESTDVAEMEFLDMIGQFIGHLNTTCYTGLNACEFHYALYEEGAFYTRHKDQFRNDSNRKFSMISYLNENWIEADGGQLIVYQDEVALPILPSGQKSVFFQSDKLEHEVAVAKRARMSITGWLKRI